MLITGDSDKNKLAMYAKMQEEIKKVGIPN